MKKALQIILSIVLIGLFSTIPVSASAGDEYTEFFLERDKEELAALPLLEVNECGSGILKASSIEELDEEGRDYLAEDKYYIKSYSFITVDEYSKLLEMYDESKSFASLISDDHIYRYVNQDRFNHVVKLRYNEERNEWSKSQSQWIKHMTKISPGLDVSMKGMIDHIAAEYPNFDFDSVKYINERNLVSDFLYFTENGQEYVAVYYERADRFDFPNGSIFTADELIDIFRQDEYFLPLVTGENMGYGGGVAASPGPSVWPAIITAGALVIAGITVAVIKLRRRRLVTEE